MERTLTEIDLFCWSISSVFFVCIQKRRGRIALSAASTLHLQTQSFYHGAERFTRHDRGKIKPRPPLVNLSPVPAITSKSGMVEIKLTQRREKEEVAAIRSGGCGQ